MIASSCLTYSIEVSKIAATNQYMLTIGLCVNIFGVQELGRQENINKEMHASPTPLLYELHIVAVTYPCKQIIV